MPIFLWSVVFSQSISRPRSGSGASSLEGASVTAMSDPPSAHSCDDERPRHRGAVDVALEVVATRRQRIDVQRLGGRAGDVGRLIEGLFLEEAVVDREVVFDPDVLVRDV